MDHEPLEIHTIRNVDPAFGYLIGLKEESIEGVISRMGQLVILSWFKLFDEIVQCFHIAILAKAAKAAGFSW